MRVSNEQSARCATRAGLGRRAPSGERGTAFIIALLVLVVLTIAGLALTLMTQTEMRIGANERLTNRSLYAADSGIEVATALGLYRPNKKVVQTFSLNTTQQDSGSTSAPTTFSDQITVTPIIPLSAQPCDFCQLNQNVADNYRKITYGANSTSARAGVNGTYSQALAQKLVGSMLTLQPQPKEYAQNAPQIPLQY